MAEATAKKPAKKVLTPEEKAELTAQAEKMTAELVEKSQKALAEFSTFSHRLTRNYPECLCYPEG